MRDFKIFFFKVGNGHCSYVEFPNNSNAIIDLKVCKEDGYDNIVSILEEANIRTIDRLIITHPHQDHIGGLCDFVDKFKITTFIHSPVNFTPDPVTLDWDTYEDMRLGEHCEKVFEVKKGWNSKIGDTRIDYLSPNDIMLKEFSDEVNNNSLLLRITCRGHKILIPGDIEDDGWDWISDSEISGTSLLLASHHGNKSGYNLEKIKKMNLAFVVISAGSKTDHDADSRYRNQARRGVHTTRNGTVVAKINSENSMTVI